MAKPSFETMMAAPGSPGVTLLLGPPNAGKLGRVVHWWQRHRQAGALIVVPTRPDVTELTLELAERCGPIVGNLPVSTFDELVSMLHDQPPVLIGELERRLLLEHLLSTRSLPTLAALTSLPGTVGALGALLQELGDSGLEPREVSAGLAAWEAAGGGALAGDIRALFQGYQAALAERGVTDRAEATRRAAAFLPGAALEPRVRRSSCVPPPRSAWTRPVACYGFTSLTPVQRLLLERLSSLVPVLVVLTADPDPVRGRVSAAEVEFWRVRARRIVTLPRQVMAFGSPEIAHLEEAFLRDPEQGEAGVPAPAGRPSGPGAAGGATGVRFLVASGRRNEAELVGAEIVTLLRHGYRPDDIGVLVREVAPWYRVLRQVFRAYGVPHRIDGRLSLGETGLGHALLQACRGVLFQELGPLMAYLRGPYGPASPGEADDIELRLRRSGHTEGPAVLREVQRALPGAVESVAAALEAAEPGGEPDLSGVLQLAAAMVTRASRGRGADTWEFENDVQALAALALGLRQLQRARDWGWVSAPGGGAPARVLRLLRLVRDLPVRTGRGDEQGVVHVLSLRRARVRRFPIVFVLGLVEGEFPGAERRPYLLGPSQRRQANRAAGAPLFAEPAAGDDVSLFVLALSRPWQLLYLSARDAEDGGEERLVSPFFVEARRVLPGTAIWKRKSLADLTLPPECAPTRREYLRACAALRRRPPDPALAGRMKATVPWHSEPRELRQPAVLRRLAARRVFAATELEDYAQCPYLWFVKRLLQPRGLEQPLTPLQKGILAHQVLSGIYRRLQQAGALPLTPQTLPVALRLLSTLLERSTAGLAVFGTATVRRLAIGEVGHLVETFLRFDARSGSALVPSHLEFDLPRGGVELGGIRVRGRVDRIDRGRGGNPVFVVDYKIGTRVHGPEFAGNGALQVPLYMMALRRLWPEASLAGGAYVGLGSGTRRGMAARSEAHLLGDWLGARSALEGEAFEGELAACLEVAAAAAAGINRGAIPAQPRKECPPFCDYSPLCRSRNKAFTA